MAHEKIGVGNLDYYLDLRVLGYAGHVERMGNERLPKILRDSCLELPQRKGRPARSMADQMRDGLKRKNISIADWKNIAMKKTEWRKAIRAPSVYAAKKTNKFENWLPIVNLLFPKTNSFSETPDEEETPSTPTGVPLESPGPPLSFRYNTFKKN
jgi:hypothetical protein